MATTFTSNANNGLTQPVSAGVYFRSTSASDTQGITLYRSGTSTAFTLEGLREIGTDATAVNQVKLASAAVGTITILGPGTAGVGDIRADTQPANNTTLTIGGVVYTWKTTLSGAANEVLIGSSTTDSILNLYYALTPIEDEEGVKYGTGTVTNPIYSAAAPTTPVITLTDKLKLRRQTAQTFAQSATHFSLRNPSVGVDGATLGTMAPGATSITRPMAFNTENALTNTLYANTTPTSDPLVIGTGENVMLRVRSGAAGAITWKYQTSVDGSEWWDGATTLEQLDNGDKLSINLAEKIDRIRIVILTNANTAADVPLNIKALH